MLTNQLPRGNKLSSATPLHISQLIYQILKFTFKNTPDDYPFKWSEDNNLTGIIFDTVFNKEAGNYGKKPLIVCSCGPITSAPVVIGDKAYESIETGNSFKTTVVNSSTVIKIVSRSYAEVEIIKNEVYKCLIAIRTLLPDFTNIHIVNQILANETRKFELDENMYLGDVSVIYMMQYAWRHDIEQNILAGMNVILNDTFGFKIN